jgi:hypothetical protein
MKFKEYVEKINELLKEDPSYGEYEVIYSSDSEGNNYCKVQQEPVPVYVDNIEDYSYLEVDFVNPEENAILIN